LKEYLPAYIGIKVSSPALIEEIEGCLEARLLNFRDILLFFLHHVLVIVEYRGKDERQNKVEAYFKQNMLNLALFGIYCFLCVIVSYLGFL